MLFRQQPTKHSILDKAATLPSTLKKAQERINDVQEKIKDLPTSLALMRKEINKRIEDYWKDCPIIATKKGVSPLSYEEIKDACLKIVFDLNKAIRSLFKLVNTKRELKEDAHLRRAKIKTGNVKKHIDQLLPDELLVELANNLESAYSNFEKITIALVMHPSNIDDYKWDTYLSLHQMLSKPLEKVKSGWFQEIMGSCLEKRNVVNKYYIEWLKEVELYYGKSFASEQTHHEPKQQRR
jgi:hypothetical protein